MKYQPLRISVQYIVAYCIIRSEAAWRRPSVGWMTWKRQTAEEENNDRRKCSFMQR